MALAWEMFLCRLFQRESL